MTQSSLGRASAVAIAAATVGVGVAWLAFRPLSTEPVATPGESTSTPSGSTELTSPLAPTASGVNGTPSSPPVPAAGGPDAERMSALGEQLAALSPALRVAGPSCAGAVCVTSLSISDPAQVADLRARAFQVALAEARDLDAQPTFRWDDPPGTGFLWFVPNRMTAEDAQRFEASAESNVAALLTR